MGMRSDRTGRGGSPGGTRNAKTATVRRTVALRLLRPLLRFSTARDAYVLRGVGRRVGPVLREDRRRHTLPIDRPDRRRSDASSAQTQVPMR